MKVLGLLGGGTPVVKKYQITATLATKGVLVTFGGDADPGILICGTTNTTDLMGVTLDTATYSTTQGDGAREVSVVINPDAIYRAKMSFGATLDTAMTSYDVTTAVSNGLTLTSGDDFTSAVNYDIGMVWWYSGNNSGSKPRHIETTTSTGLTVEVPFENATVVGDEFIVSGVSVAHDIAVGQIQLTSDISQVNASIVPGTGAELVAIDGEFNDIAKDGKNNSFYHLLSTDHSFSGSALA